MCGTFYVDDETAREIEKVIRQVDERANFRANFQGDIRPSDLATVISSVNNHRMTTSAKRWGFPGFQTGKLIINARAESALDKKMFRDSLLRRRLIIPAAGFYEWNSRREKVTFTPCRRAEKSASILFFAGFYQHFEDGDKFVILTTAANDSMKDVHDRMPLTLAPWELEDWLFNPQKTEDFLHQIPAPLNRTQEYMQQSLPFA